MKIIQFCFSITLLFVSCKQRIDAYYQKEKLAINNTNRTDSAIVNSIYKFDAWNTYFKSQRTHNGFILRLKLINEKEYQVQWGKDNLQLHTYSDTFLLDGNSAWIPRIIGESEDFILLRQGCGNPCWKGMFLPKNKSDSVFTASEYIHFDLKQNLVVYPREKNEINILNLKSKKIQKVKIEGCKSAFINYCIDSVSIKDNNLILKWQTETHINSTNGIFKTIKILI